MMLTGLKFSSMSDPLADREFIQDIHTERQNNDQNTSRWTEQAA